DPEAAESHDLKNAGSDLTDVEAMDAEISKESAQQSRREDSFLAGVRRRGGLAHPALGTDLRLGVDGCSARVAEAGGWGHLDLGHGFLPLSFESVTPPPACVAAADPDRARGCPAIPGVA